MEPYTLHDPTIYYAYIFSISLIYDIFEIHERIMELRPMLIHYVPFLLNHLLFHAYDMNHNLTAAISND